jgi:photosystem II stability/assembly factor-like uncharacterized protein
VGKSKVFQSFILVSILVFGLCCHLAYAKNANQKDGYLIERALNGLEWRCIGPANWEGRVVDFAVPTNNPCIIYVATASGGVWKSINNGTTWEPIFDDQSTSSIGDVEVSPSNPEIIWVGTGEANNRQSSSWGNGIYKSNDGGKTWVHKGLEDTHHIGRIVIHPTNPDIVYVAALGHLWGPNKQRGLFMTTDGGETWINTKHIDENAGFVDVAMDPKTPTTLYAAAYQRRRRGWGFNGGGPGSGIYRTEDGGKTWHQLNKGLPQGIIGRIGIDVYKKNPNIVYALVEHKEGGVFRSDDKGMSWTKMSSTNPRPMYYSQIRIDPNNDQRIWVLGATLFVSKDGGKNFQTDYIKEVRPDHFPVHIDYHALWINPRNSRHMIAGTDGGIYFSYDQGRTWDFVNSLPLAQFYDIAFDMRKPYFVYGGLQDNGVWAGPSANYNAFGITNEDWARIGDGDGFHVQVDPTDYKTVYYDTQYGNIMRLDIDSFQSKSLKPKPENDEEIYRFNWNSPILLSPHDPNTIFIGGNRLFISHDKGETWKTTEDLTSQFDMNKMPVMGVLVDRGTPSRNDGILFYGNITTVSESPLKKGLLYAGTDDGNLQISLDGGENWKNIIDKIKQLPEKIYVSRVITSNFEEGRAYATFDNHRNDDFAPYVYCTNDYGENWQPISNDIPNGDVVNVICEHHKNPDLLFLGTERGVNVSINRGQKWMPIKANLPVMPVDDIAIHPRENDLLLGTHGRGIWILDDITPFEHLTPEVLNSPIHLFDIREATIFNPRSRKYTGTPFGHKIFVAPNPPFGAIISYFLKEDTKKGVKIIIRSKDGKAVNEIKGPNKSGINRVEWNLRYSSPSSRNGEILREQGPFVLPGEYQVSLELEKIKTTKTVKLVGDPRIDVTFKELKAQHDALYALHELFPALVSATKVSKELKDQLDTLIQRINSKKTPVLIRKKIRALALELREIRTSLIGNPALGRLSILKSVRGRFNSLTESLERYMGRPTTQQLKLVQKTTEELRRLVKRLNKLIQDELNELNILLDENGIPQIPALEKVVIAEKIN